MKMPSLKKYGLGTLWRRKRSTVPREGDESEDQASQYTSEEANLFPFAKHVVFILAALAVVAVLMPAIYSKFKNDHNKVIEGYASLRPNTTSPYFTLYNLSSSAPNATVNVSILSIDLTKRTYTAHVFTRFNDRSVWLRSEFDPNATVCLMPYGAPTQCTTYVSRSSRVHNSASWQEGLATRVDAAFAAASDSSKGLQEASWVFYPFDRYSGSFSFSIFDAPSEIYDKVDSPPITPYRPFKYGFDTDIQGFNAEITFVQWEKFGAIEAHFVIRRGLMSRSFSILVMMFMWILVILEATAVFDVIMRKRNHEGPMLALSIGAIFALPGIRSAQPGVPPVLGCLSDVLAYWWCMPIAVITCIVSLCTFVLRHQGKAEEKDAKEEAGGDCKCCEFQCKCYGENEKPSMNSNEGGKDINIYAMNVNSEKSSNAPSRASMGVSDPNITVSRENLLPEYRSDLGKEQCETEEGMVLQDRRVRGRETAARSKSLPSSYV